MKHEHFGYETWEENVGTRGVLDKPLKNISLIDQEESNCSVIRQSNSRPTLGESKLWGKHSN